MNTADASISVVIPTYRRERVLLDTIDYLVRLDPGGKEIVIVDQTEEHSAETASALQELANVEQVRWLRLAEPSIPHAMNAGLKE
ncbi:MAG TPA: glycosyltransferase, partial [Blastocatellia bacterium]|nr:glycosyltransferase [Blastocatellia bacterium]